MTVWVPSSKAMKWWKSSTDEGTAASTRILASPSGPDPTRRRRRRADVCHAGISRHYPAFLSGCDALVLSAAISIGPTENCPTLAFSVSARR